jgi:hypothetical protein
MNSKTRQPKQIWDIGSVFSIEQSDGFYCVGQVLDLMLPNVPSCAFYDLRFKTGTVPENLQLLNSRVIAALSTTREQLDRGAWKVVATRPIEFPRDLWPNENLRAVDWVGAVTYGAGIVTRFLEAFYGLSPWNYYADPNYFDALLFDQRERPKNVVFKK